MRRLAALALALLIAGPALAQNEADGPWDCKLDDGTEFGSLGLNATQYVFANPRGASGRGNLAYQPDADAPTFVILDGALVSVGTLGGWLDDSMGGAERYLTLVDALGNVVDCLPRP